MFRRILKGAGGTWVDQEVIVSNGVVTSRNPDDIPAFNREMISLFSKGARQSGQSERKVA
ncbi:MAG TPA: DJ-1/PfpI family protein [Candidatus Acidoferrum sp.]|nr:DJ-1/PfpI family protein [Candidatus Acidoferrum sp.]